jgi:hypothetical protein
MLFSWPSHNNKCHFKLISNPTLSDLDEKWHIERSWTKNLLTAWGLKSHAGCQNYTRACGIAASQNPINIFWWSYVNFSWFVFKSHVSSWNSTRACVNHTRACRIHTHTCQNHTLCALTLCVEIALCIYKSYFAFRNYTRACVHHSQGRTGSPNFGGPPKNADLKKKKKKGHYIRTIKG